MFHCIQKCILIFSQAGQEGARLNWQSLSRCLRSWIFICHIWFILPMGAEWKEWRSVRSEIRMRNKRTRAFHILAILIPELWIKKCAIRGLLHKVLKNIFIDRIGQGKDWTFKRHFGWKIINFPNVVQQRNKRYKRVFLCKQSLLLLFCKPLQCTYCVREHLRHYPVQYLENIGPAKKQSDWLILVIDPLAA